MSREIVVEKLKVLGVFPKNDKNEIAEIFEKCTNLYEIGKECGRRHWSCGSGQFVYFHLEALMKKEPEYRAGFLADAKQGLGGFGISPEHIEEYFSSGTDPSSVFSLIYEKQYDIDARMNFYEKANQFALDRMKKWLDI